MHSVLRNHGDASLRDMVQWTWWGWVGLDYPEIFSDLHGSTAQNPCN